MKKYWYIALLLIYTTSLKADFRGAKITFLHRRDEQGTTTINNPDLPYIIDRPGNYKIISPLVLDATVSTTIVSIQSSDVKINFNGKRLTQTLPSTKNVTGIHIADNLANISIENGNINNITGTGLIIGQNCFNIGIQNMTIVQTGSGGIEIQSGTDTVSLHNCFIGKSLTAGKNNTGISLTSNKNISVTQSSVIGVRAPSGYNAYNFHADSCNYCFLSDSAFNGAIGDTAIGIYLENCNDFKCNNNETNGNIASSGSGHGIYLNNSKSNIFEKHHAQQNKGSINAYGIYLGGTSNYNKYTHTTTSHQQTTGTGSAYGIYTSGTTSNHFLTISSVGNSGGSSISSEGVGIRLANVTGTTVESSYCSYNNGNTGKGYGIYLTGNSYCVIEGNKLYYNHGDAGGYGIRETGTPSSFVAGNQAFGNGTNYQLTLLTLNSIQTVSYDSPRSIQTSNKGNISITS